MPTICRTDGDMQQMAMAELCSKLSSMQHPTSALMHDRLALRRGGMRMRLRPWGKSSECMSVLGALIHVCIHLHMMGVGVCICKIVTAKLGLNPISLVAHLGNGDASVGSGPIGGRDRSEMDEHPIDKRQRMDDDQDMSSLHSRGVDVMGLGAASITMDRAREMGPRVGTLINRENLRSDGIKWALAIAQNRWEIVEDVDYPTILTPGHGHAQRRGYGRCRAYLSGRGKNRRNGPRSQLPFEWDAIGGSSSSSHRTPRCGGRRPCDG